MKKEFKKSQKSFKNLQQVLKHLKKAVKQIDKIINGDYDEELKKHDEKLRAQLPKLLAELAHIIKYDDYAYEKEIRLVQFAFEDDIDSDTGVKSTYCEDNHGIYSNAPDFIKFESITTAPKVGEKEYLYARYLGDSNDIEVKKSEIKFQ